MKKPLIGFFLPIVLFSAMAIWGSLVHAAMETTIEEIKADKDSYDQKEVSVSGIVSTPKFKARRLGKPYMTFPILGSSEGRINILLWGDMGLKPGRKVAVTGIYRKTLKMGKYTFRDIIEASKLKKIEENKK